MASVLFSLDCAWVTRNEPGLFQGWTELGVDLHQGPRDPVTNGTCLARISAAGDIHIDIKISGRLRHIEWLQDNHPSSLPAEIFLQGFRIDRDSALARL